MTSIRMTISLMCCSVLVSIRPPKYINSRHGCGSRCSPPTLCAPIYTACAVNAITPAGYRLPWCYESPIYGHHGLDQILTPLCGSAIDKNRNVRHKNGKLPLLSRGAVASSCRQAALSSQADVNATSGLRQVLALR